MNKKIMLLALGAISAVLLALPAMASALVPLHLNPTPAKFVVDNIGGAPLLSSGGGNLKCTSVSGTGTFQAGGTTGEMTLTFGPHCTGSFGETCTNKAVNNHITTTPLPFHLVTVEHPAGGGGKSPGVLVTPADHVAHYTCHTFLGTLDQTIEGNGLIGTITNPACGGSSSEPTIEFAQASTGNQTHTRVVGTATVYSLKKGGENAAQKATAKLTLQDSAGKAVVSKLECT